MNARTRETHPLTWRLDHEEPVTGIGAYTTLDGYAALRKALAGRDGPILPVLTAEDPPARFSHERAISIDTTAAGGNVALLAAGDE